LRARIKKIIPRRFLIQHLDKKHGNSVLLTFDDGPDPLITSQVLVQLKKYNAQAVFFIPGNRIYKSPDMLQTILDQKHLLGNHSYNHPNLQEPHFREYYADLKKCQQEIEKITHKIPKLFRPPKGRISVKSLIIPKLLDLSTMTWSLDPEDWRCKNEKEARLSAKYIIDHVKPRDIILLHDDNPCVVTILNMILPVLAEKKFDLFSAVEHII